MPTQTASASRIAAFFGVTLLITWAAQAVPVLVAKGVLAGPPERFMGLLGLGLFGPIVAAMVLSRGEPGGVRGLFAQLGNWRVGPIWYVLALALPGVLMTLGMAVYRLTTGNDPGPWTYFPREPERITALILIPFTEEFGWRGYALPRLQAITGRVQAAAIIGAFWAIWHIPMYLVQGIPMVWMPVHTAYFVAGSLVFSWLYNRSGMSLPIAIAAHMGAHLDSSGRSMPGNMVPFLSQFGAYVVLAIALLVFDRKAWRRPQRPE